MSRLSGLRPLGVSFTLATFLGLAITAALPLGSRGQQDAASRPAPDGSRLPHADPQFRGVANRTLAGSKPDFPHPVTAPKGAERAAGTD